MYVYTLESDVTFYVRISYEKTKHIIDKNMMSKIKKTDI